jgi:XTP/dITP diphosphohydrolase
MNIIIASRNEGKLKEFQSLLMPHELIARDIEVDETGLSFHENALLKARACAMDEIGCFIGDDSGIMIDALGGMPGVNSKNFKGASDGSGAILNVLSSLDVERSSAMMICCIAMVTHKNDPLPMFFLGVVHGEFHIKPKGESSFPYDPYLYVPKLGKTFAQMSADMKNQNSPRALATANLKRCLDQL